MSETQEWGVAPSAELQELTDQTELEPTRAEAILRNFTSLFEEAHQWEKQARAIVITDPSQTEEMAAARAARLALKAIRVKAEKVKKALKEGVLLEGRYIDGVYNAILMATKPIEQKLLEKEQYVERMEAERIERLITDRREKLAPYVGVDQLEYYRLGEMTDEAFVKLVDNSRMAMEQRVAAEKQAEEERKAREEAEAEERERIRLENEQLLKEKEEREAEIAKERAEREAKEKVEREEREAKEEADRLERERVEAERQAEIAKEKAERERLEAELKAEREAKEKKQREEREAIERAERERLAEEARLKAVPDHAKLRAVGQRLAEIQLPELDTPSACRTRARVREHIAQAIQTISEEIGTTTSTESAK